MCDPVSIGSLAVGAAGKAISGYEASQNAAAQINARNEATKAELERSRVYSEKAQQPFNNSLSIYEPTAQTEGLANSQSSIGDVLARNAPANVGSITTAGAPRVVGESESRRLGDVADYGTTKDANLAALKGYDQQMFGNKLGLNQNARDIDMIGDFAKTSAGVNAIEQRAAANNATKTPSGLGDLLSFAGAIGANQAGRGGMGSIFARPALASPGFSTTGTGGIF